MIGNKIAWILSIGTMLWLLLWTSGAIGAPWLISDPYGPCGESGQSACPVTCNIYRDGTLIAEGIAVTPDMAVFFDLETMPQAEHSYTAVFVDALGRASEQSNPYLLLAPPASPKNLRGTNAP